MQTDNDREANIWETWRPGSHRQKELHSNDVEAEQDRHAGGTFHGVDGLPACSGRCRQYPDCKPPVTPARPAAYPTKETWLNAQVTSSNSLAMGRRGASKPVQ